MFCSQCGTKLPDTAKFCVNCGAPVKGAYPTPVEHGVITLQPHERRVPVASLQDDPQAWGAPITVPKDSAEALNANTPFDPSRRLGEDTLVPADCVWAYDPHPGRFPDNPANHRSIDSKFVAMGTLRGRTFNEIQTTAGAPLADHIQADLRSTVWGKSSMWSGIWQIHLLFDSYGVCIRIGSENNLGF